MPSLPPLIGASAGRLSLFREGSPSRERETAMLTRGSSRIEPAGLPCTAPYSDKAPPTHPQYLPRDLQRAHPPSRAAGAGAVPSQSTSAALAQHGGISGVTLSGHSRAGGGPEAVDHGSESLLRAEGASLLHFFQVASQDPRPVMPLGTRPPPQPAATCPRWRRSPRRRLSAARAAMEPRDGAAHVPQLRRAMQEKILMVVQ